MEVPLQDVRMRIFDELTKHPMYAPMVLSVLQMKGRLGRNTQEEISLT